MLQYGPISEVFRAPQSPRVASAFSDPPMNLVATQVSDGGQDLRNEEPKARPLPRQHAQRLEERQSTLNLSSVVHQAVVEQGATAA